MGRSSIDLYANDIGAAFADIDGLGAALFQDPDGWILQQHSGQCQQLAQRHGQFCAGFAGVGL